MNKNNLLSQKPVILLSIETKAREFPGKVLLSCFLAEKGFRVILTNNRKESEVRKFSPWLFIDRNTFAPRLKFFKNLKRLATRIVCLDEEGILWYNPDQYRKRLNEKTNNLVDLYCTWGSKQTELVKEINKNSRVIETGNPRMDLFRPELRSIYQQKSDLLKAKYGEFILVVSNFSTNNYFYTKETDTPILDVIIKQMYYQGLITNREDEDFVKGLYYNKLEVFEKLHKVIGYLSNRFPKMKIVVRPHPSENHDVWKESMKNYSNVYVIFEGDLTSWILASRVVIHNSCTSGLESALLNRKAIAFVPLDTPQYEQKLPNSVSAIAVNEKEVADLVEKSPLVQIVPEVLNEYISALSGSFACERITDAICELYEKKQPLARILLRRVLFASMSFFLFINRIKELITSIGTRDIFKVRESKMNYLNQKFSGITNEEVIEYIQIYSKLLKKFENVKSAEVDSAFEIYNAYPD